MKGQNEFIIVKVNTWFLQFKKELPMIKNPSQFEYWAKPLTTEYLKLYHEIGDLWGWTGRLLLSDDELQELLFSAQNEVWLFKHQGQVIGFSEIDFSIDGKAEIVYMGLIPSNQTYINAGFEIIGETIEFEYYPIGFTEYKG